MKPPSRQRSILHLDLHPFFVSVERTLDPALRGRPVVIGSGPEGGLVAAASAEARAAGVRAGQTVSLARRLCPAAVFRPGDLESYARASDQVTSLLLTASRRVERPSADEAWVDLTPEQAGAPRPVAAAEAIRSDLQRRLGLEAALGLASSRLAARVASAAARPRGLLIVLPGYEASFLARQPVSCLPDLPPHLAAALDAGGIETLGDVTDCDPARLAGLVGDVAASRLREAAVGRGEEPVAVTAPPTRITESGSVRDRRSDAPTILDLVEALAQRAGRRLRPFALAAGTVTVEVSGAHDALRREESFEPALGDEATLGHVARELATPLLLALGRVRSVHVRLARLAPAGELSPLFPREAPGPAPHRRLI